MSSILSKSTNPGCPKCGCNATTLIDAGMRGGRPWARYECSFCSHAFTNGAEPRREGESIEGVVYPRLKCPRCKSKDVSTTSSPLPTRFHKCNACGKNFKSIEEN